MSPEFPPVHLLASNLGPEELEKLEESIPTLTWNAHEAGIVVGRITRRERALFELRRLKVQTTEVKSDSERASLPADAVIKVVKLGWLTDSLKQGTVLPTQPYLIYEGKKAAETAAPSASAAPKTISTSSEEKRTNLPDTSSRLQRVERRTSDVALSKQTERPSHAPASRRKPSDRPPLLHETTSEHDVSLPPVPDYLHTTYSCQRPTPVDSPNATFIEQLKRIRTHRLLEGDKVGVRAYSTTIAAVAAYPFPLKSSIGN